MQLKPIKDLDITDDYTFGQFVLNFKGLVSRLLEVILGIKVASIKYYESQKTQRSFFNSKGVRFDFFAEGSSQKPQRFMFKSA